jgi:hypothetical protein
MRGHQRGSTGGSMINYFEKDGMMVGRMIADEFILVPIRQNVSDLQYMYTLNKIGSRIWQLLDTHKTVGELVAAITKEYDVEMPQAETDVIEFLDQLLEIGAVEEKAAVG